MDGKGDHTVGRVGSQLWQGGIIHPQVRASHNGRIEMHPVARMQPRQIEAPFHTVCYNSYPMNWLTHSDSCQELALWQKLTLSQSVLEVTDALLLTR